MTREDFVYALENAGLINCVRDEKNSIDVEATINSRDFETGCRSPHGEWLSCKAIYDILDEWDVFN